MQVLQKSLHMVPVWVDKRCTCARRWYVPVHALHAGLQVCREEEHCNVTPTVLLQCAKLEHERSHLCQDLTFDLMRQVQWLHELL